MGIPPFRLEDGTEFLGRVTVVAAKTWRTWSVSRQGLTFFVYFRAALRSVRQSAHLHTRWLVCFASRHSRPRNVPAKAERWNVIEMERNEGHPSGVMDISRINLRKCFCVARNNQWDCGCFPPERALMRAAFVSIGSWMLLLSILWSIKIIINRLLYVDADCRIHSSVAWAQRIKVSFQISKSPGVQVFYHSNFQVSKFQIFKFLASQMSKSSSLQIYNAPNSRNPLMKLCSMANSTNTKQ